MFLAASQPPRQQVRRHGSRGDGRKLIDTQRKRQAAGHD
jgi:hypothetical protein